MGNCRAQIRFWKGAFSLNPKGIPQQSPGLRGTSYPGATDLKRQNPNGVSALVNVRSGGSQPRWGCCFALPLTQGSSFLATLGFVAESRWDSKKRHASKT